MSSRDVRSGTVGGMFLSVFAAIIPNDFVKTVILSALGAAVSFTISFLLKKITDKFSENKRVR